MNDAAVKRATLIIACRLIAGVGGAMAFVTYVAILTSVYPREERGRAIGITTTSVYIGLSIGPFLGGLLTHHLGWRSIFFIILGKAIITPDLYPQFLKSLKIVLATNGTLCFFAIFFSLTRGKIRHGGG